MNNYAPHCHCISCQIMEVIVAQTAGSRMQPIAEDLGHWDTQSARQKLDKLLERNAEDPILLFHYAHLLYLEGKYEDAVATYAKLPEDLLQVAGPKRMHQQAMKTADTLRSFNEHQTNDGRFLIRYEGKDKLLIPYLWRC